MWFDWLVLPVLWLDTTNCWPEGRWQRCWTPWRSPSLWSRRPTGSRICRRSCWCRIVAAPPALPFGLPPSSPSPTTTPPTSATTTSWWLVPVGRKSSDRLFMVRAVYIYRGFKPRLFPYDLSGWLPFSGSVLTGEMHDDLGLIQRKNNCNLHHFNAAGISRLPSVCTVAYFEVCSDSTSVLLRCRLWLVRKT